MKHSSFFGRSYFAAVLSALLLFLLGCGTEVGNPDSEPIDDPKAKNQSAPADKPVDTEYGSKYERSDAPTSPNDVKVPDTAAGSAPTSEGSPQSGNADSADGVERRNGMEIIQGTEPCVPSHEHYPESEVTVEISCAQIVP